MEFLGNVVEWFGDPGNWSGSFGVPSRLTEHILMSLLAVGIASALALPPALFIGHTRRAEFLVVSMANVGRALPSLAILAFLVPFSIRLGLGIGFWPTLVALIGLAIPPILTNTYVGIQNVDPDTLEAARGMGMGELEVLRRIEVPLAMPLIMSGFRIATLQVVATATLAALVGWGGLGRIIVDGFAVRDFAQVFAGALIVGVLALAVDLVLGRIERLVSPRTTSAGERMGRFGKRTEFGAV